MFVFFSLFPPLVLNCKGDRKCHWGHERFRAGFACVTSLSLIVRSFLFSQSVLVGLSLFFVIGINSDQDCHQPLSSVEWLVLHEELPEEGQDRSDQLPRTPVNWLKNCKFFFLIHWCCGMQPMVSRASFFFMFIDHPMRSYLSLVSRACFLCTLTIPW